MGLRTGELIKGHGEVDLARDRELVERCQAGDSSAFDDLYLRYFDRLYRFCLRRVGVPAEAEDIAQEAFTRAWRALPKFTGDRRFYPWLSVIASNLCTDTLRRRSRSTPVAEMDEMMPASANADGCEDEVMRAVDADLLSEAFSRLSERHRQVLQMREESGWSYQRIAEHEGVRVSAVEAVLWRARQALKRELISLAGAEGGLVAVVFSWARLARSRLSRLARLAPQSVNALRFAGGGMLMSSVAALVVIATMSVSPPASPSARSSAHQPVQVQRSPSAAIPQQQRQLLQIPRRHAVSTSTAGTRAAPVVTAAAPAVRPLRAPAGGVASVASTVTGALPAVTNLLGGGVHSAGSTAKSALAGALPAVTNLLGGGVHSAESTAKSALAGAP